MTPRPPDSARVWLPSAAPPAMADAVRRGGGELVPSERANAIVWYGSAHAPPDHVLDLRALLSDAVAWVQLPWAGVEEAFERDLVDTRRVWTSAAGAYGPAVAEHVVAMLLAAARRLPECARADLLAPLGARGRARWPAARSASSARAASAARRSGCSRPSACACWP